MSRWLITGGAGFIGTNLVLRLLQDGHNVTVVDNLCRNGSETNLSVLRDHGLAKAIHVSVADAHALQRALAVEEEPDIIVHLAGQVSLMRSIEQPREDFIDNALGTLNILELLRTVWPKARLIFSSTNKVYGELSGVRFVEEDRRFVAPDFSWGMDESLPLDFHGGYSCSKGTADQYVLDYHRQYGLDTVVLRQSAICGAWQNPKADQGWASFLVQETVNSRVVHLNGVGKQVRDLLDVEDLVELFLRIGSANIEGQRVFNVGGGPSRALSLLNFFSELELRGFSPRFEVGPMRPSDQLVFVADTRLVEKLFDWKPRYSLAEVIDRLVDFELKRRPNSNRHD